MRSSGDPAEAADLPGGLAPETLRLALGRLSATHQEVIMLRFHADLAPADAAHALGVTPSAAGVRLHRAIAALRHELADANGLDEGRSDHDR